MSSPADRLAALRARVKAKQDIATKKTDDRIATEVAKEKEADAQARTKRRAEVLDAMRDAAAEKAAQATSTLAAEAGNGGAPASKRPLPLGGEAPPPKCRCGLEAKRLAVKKEGPNFGRSFYKCPQEQEDKRCRFFEWGAADAQSTNDSASLPAPSGMPLLGGRLPPTPMAAGAATAATTERRCLCGGEAVLRTVSKEGPHFGRRFWYCALGPECKSPKKFFEWDGVSEAVPAAMAATPERRCPCGAEAVLRTVRKEGPNLGRSFWCCAEGPECKSSKKFFEWDGASEAVPAPVVGQAGKGPASGAGTAACFRCGGLGHFARDCSAAAKADSGGAGGAAASGASCYRCGQTGHFARNCPAQANAGAIGD